MALLDAVLAVTLGEGSSVRRSGVEDTHGSVRLACEQQLLAVRATASLLAIAALLASLDGGVRPARGAGPAPPADASIPWSAMREALSARLDALAAHARARTDLAALEAPAEAGGDSRRSPQRRPPRALTHILDSLSLALHACHAGWPDPTAIAPLGVAAHYSDVAKAGRGGGTEGGGAAGSSAGAAGRGGREDGIGEDSAAIRRLRLAALIAAGNRYAQKWGLRSE